MIYFANPTTGSLVAMRAGLIGFIATPRQGTHPPPDVIWCLDNNCFSDSFDEQKWWRWLQARNPANCVFAAAPDVVGDMEATLARSRPWLPRIRQLGYPAALVAQDGATPETALPWNDFDVLFIGGTDEFKLGVEAFRLVRLAKQYGKHVHMGRVNSLKRCRYAKAIGCDSVDGSCLTFGPDRRLPEVLGWVHVVTHEMPLFELEVS